MPKGKKNMPSSSKTKTAKKKKPSSSKKNTGHSVALSNGRRAAIYGERKNGTLYYKNGCGQRKTLAAHQIVYSKTSKKTVGRGKDAVKRSLKK